MARGGSTEVESANEPPRPYPDLHEHIRRLDAAGLLVRIDRPIDKDSELHPLVRWQFRGGIAEKDRKAFLFTNVIDATGKRYDLPVLVGSLATNREIYRIGMMCDLDKISDTWMHAMRNPIPPTVVDVAPCQDIVIEGERLRQPGQGLDALPFPISTPGWDIAPYATQSQFITRDPDNGAQNMGIYRAQIKGPLRLGMNPSLEGRPGIYAHWQKYKKRGQKMPAAVVIGGPPFVSFTSVQKLPHDVDELHVAGGLIGQSVNVVRARTVDLLVPAEAEIVIEGFIDTDYLEREGPVGESHGHVNPQEYNAFMEVTCITRRSNAILSSIISQVTPSESSLIKRVALEPLYLNHLRNVLGLKYVKHVGMHEALTNLRRVLAVVVEHGTSETLVWQALYGVASFMGSTGKCVIAVNEDIDVDNADSLFWAMSYRANFGIDLHVLPHRMQGHGPKSDRNNGQDGCLLINATLKENLPPVSLPKREYMERAKEIWEELGLPRLKPEAPWYGYALGAWPEEFEEAARRAAKGDYLQYAQALQQSRRSDVSMNTEVRDVDPPAEEGNYGS